MIVTDQDLDKWMDEQEREFWSNPEEVAQFERWLEKLYMEHYATEDEREEHEEHGESFTPEQVGDKIENAELPF